MDERLLDGRELATRVLERIVGVQDFWTGDPRAGNSVEEFHELRDRVGTEHDITVQYEDIRLTRELYTLVACTRIPGVAGIPDKVGGRELGDNHFRASVG
jgi:hypothetical protein